MFSVLFLSILPSLDQCSDLLGTPNQMAPGFNASTPPFQPAAAHTSLIPLTPTNLSPLQSTPRQFPQSNFAADTHSLSKSEPKAEHSSFLSALTGKNKPNSKKRTKATSGNHKSQAGQKIEGDVKDQR